MAILTESRHPGEFIASEANGTLSREVGILKNNQALTDGTVLEKDVTGDLVAATGDLDTNDEVVNEVVGILVGNHDTTANGPDGNVDKPGVVYIARDAEVKDALLVYPAESTAGGEKAATVASLAKLHIIPR